MESSIEDDENLQESLSLAWWNTSLSPRGKDRVNNKENQAIAGEAIALMLIEKKIDFLGLGEVSQSDVTYFEDLFNDTPYSITSCFEKVGKGQFCQAYIYNANKIRISNEKVLEFSILGRNYRVGHSLVISTKCDSLINVVVSHWPSKLQSENDRVRNYLASTLRNKIHNLSEANVVLMGDFNAEPFEESMSEHLLASRDKLIVRKKKELFYNPFWSKLGMSECQGYCGSYFFKSGMSSNWLLFDQIIVSSNFLNDKGWSLINEKSLIGTEDILKLVKNTKLHFDHLPVFTQLEKVNV